jgi:hypothetical protein
MAYNVFKRPMFKRGGSTKGTGIMSHVEPRVGYKEAGSVMSKLGNYFNSPALGPDGKPIVFQKRNFLDDASFVLGPGKFLKVGGAGLNILRKAGEFAKFPKNYPTRGIKGQGKPYLQYADKPGLFTNRGIMEAVKPYTTGMTKTLKDFGQGVGTAAKDFYKKYGIAAGIGAPVVGGLGYGIKKGYDSLMEEEGMGNEFAEARGAMTSDEAYNGVVEEAANAVENTDSGRKPKYKEADLRTKVQKEADEIMDMIKDEDLNKAEAALLISKALKTPGSISDKIDVAVTDAMGIAKRKSQEDKQVKLMAYKAVKEKEIAEAKQSELPPLGRMIQRLADLESADPKLLSASEKNEMKYLREKLNEESFTEKANIKVKAGIYERNQEQIPSLKVQINDYLSRLKELDEDELADLKKKQELLAQLESFGAELGFKDGGRVEYAEGSENPNAPTIESDETKGGSNVFPTKTVEKLSFAELRQKLPEEITNDIVQLISNSEEALQDFAYIKTQTDINDFNLKYGVNLVLPPQQG